MQAAYSVIGFELKSQIENSLDFSLAEKSRSVMKSRPF